MKYRAYLTPSGAVVIGICFFLPWAHFSCTGVRVSVSGAGLGGILWLIPIMAMVIVAAFFHLQKKGKFREARLIILTAIGLALIALIWKIVAILNAPKPAFGLIKPEHVGFRLGIGAFGTLMGLMLLMAAWSANFFHTSKNYTQVQSQDSNQCPPSPGSSSPSPN
jgi:hypothetical protein